MAQNISIIEIDGTRQLIQLSSADDLQAALEDFRKACVLGTHPKWVQIPTATKISSRILRTAFLA
jgi:hypothetical protein